MDISTKMAKASIVRIYTDGACAGNPGAGGWGALLSFEGVEKEIFGGESVSTNNRMELLAAIKALEVLKRPSKVRLSTDSVYLKDGITKWINNWKANGWRTAGKKPVKNVDLWKHLLEAAGPHEIQWEWIKGHSGNPGNERADALARQGIAEGFEGN